MSKRIAALLAALVLVCVLTACEDRQQSADSPQTGLTDKDHGDTNAGDDVRSEQDTPLVTVPDTVPDTPPTPAEDPADGGVPLDQMLRNGLVRDQDGDLSDRTAAVRHGR